MCSGRDPTTSTEQQVSVIFNGEPIGSEKVSERVQKLYFRIPPHCVLGHSLHRLELRLAHAAPVLDDNRKTVDGPKLELNVRGFGIAAKNPALRVPPDQIFNVETDGERIISAARGLWNVEDGAVWIDGLTASLDLELSADDGKRWLALMAAGRRSVASGKAQTCLVSLDGKLLGKLKLEEYFEQFFLEIPANIAGDKAELKLTLAHAESVRDRAGNVVDARDLGARIKSLGIVTARPGATARLMAKRRRIARLTVGVARRLSRTFRF
jgi:hypothetical protein